ncbi:MAG TPA: glutamate-1-semialdehyde 2,1-aminomutase [Chloroflexota bacterium]|nr:glutamate-1-semialdehyde 2,1-aminomutase [Chloroflexota bacterium]
MHNARPNAKSRELFAEARKYLPGGVDSPVRAFRAVGGDPRFIVRGSGSRITDADGNDYVDYVSSWGPLILGHAYPAVVEAIRSAAERGTSYGAPTALETELARLVIDAFPSIQKVRFVNSGTEATMSALRLARGFTGRSKIVKFDGCYHGHADGLLVKAGSGVLTLGAPDSPGVPAEFAALTLSAPFNDLGAVTRVFAEQGEEIAAVIVEPVPGNMGVVPPHPGFLAGLREITSAYGTLLIFDEVITGFRVALGGMQEITGIQPDLTCLGKIIGGGLPVGAYGGRADIMAHLAPEGPVYQAGTLAGNPLAMSAGIATLTELGKPGTYERLESETAALIAELGEAARATGIHTTTNRVGSMFTTFFANEPVVDYVTARRADTLRYARYFRAMLDRGIYLAPSQFEAGFLSLAHTPDDRAQTVAAAREAFALARED